MGMEGRDRPVPIACSLTPDDLRDRGAAWRRVLGSGLVKGRRASGGKRSLDDLIIEMVRRKKSGDRADDAFWLSLLDGALGPEGRRIHDDMLAYLVVTDAPYYGRTDKSGAWLVEVPRGRYHVSIWHPRMRDAEADLERELTVGEGDRAELTLHLAKALQPAPIADRPHSWDY